MLGEAMYTTIKTLWEVGNNKSEISRATNHDWKTVSKVINNLASGYTKPVRKERLSILDPYKEEVIKLLEEGLSGVRIHEELSAKGFNGKYGAVKKYISKLRRKQDIFLRIHTPVGQEAQVDFGYAGRSLDDEGKRRKTWVFNMRLGYSRYDYYERVYDQKVETFIKCHINAFEYFGGVPEVVKIDNLKAAILKANFYEPVYQNLYKEFSNYYGFKPVPCRIYHPNDKGKVESGIRYVKVNFFQGRKFVNGTDCTRKLKEWLEKANRRIHGTTRKVPYDVFIQEEQKSLSLLPICRYQLPTVGSRLVYHDCHIFVDYNYYSVPFECVGKEVDIALEDNLLRIFYKGEQVALHSRQEGRGKFSTKDWHYPRYKRYCETEYQEEYQVKMAQLGAFAEQIFFLIVKENKNYWAQPVKGILSLSKKYPKEIIDLSCKRALAYGVYHYQTIKRICENGSYNLPVEFDCTAQEVYQ